MEHGSKDAAKQRIYRRSQRAQRLGQEEEGKALRRQFLNHEGTRGTKRRVPARRDFAVGSTTRAGAGVGNAKNLATDGTRIEHG